MFSHQNGALLMYLVGRLLSPGPASPFFLTRLHAAHRNPYHQVLRVQRVVYNVETAFANLDAARARPPPVASFTQSTSSSAGGSRSGQSRRESSGGGSGSGGAGGTGASDGSGVSGAKRPRPRAGDDDDGDLDALVNGGGGGGSVKRGKSSEAFGSGRAAVRS